jgi:hypothetical protein
MKDWDPLQRNWNAILLMSKNVENSALFVVNFQMSTNNARELNAANSLKQDQNFWWEVANFQLLLSVSQKTLKNARQSVQAEDAQENIVANSLNWTTKLKNSPVKLLDNKFVNLSNIIVAKLYLMEDANQKFVALTKRMEKSSKNFLANKMVPKFVNEE